MSTTGKIFVLPVLIAGIALGTGNLISSKGYAADSLDEREKALLKREKALEQREAALKSQMKGSKSHVFSEMDDILPAAKAGQCFAKVLVPAIYKSVEEKVVIQEAGHKIDIIPAKYERVKDRVMIKEASQKVVEVPAVYQKVSEKILTEPSQKVWRKRSNARSRLAPADWVKSAIASGVPKEATLGSCYEEVYQAAKYETVEEKVLRREAGKRIDVIPAKYEWVEKKVLVKEESVKIVDVPSVYETKEDKILERAAYTTWKKGRGPIERIDNSTGEIMCLIEVPAKYKTVKKQILVSAATTKKITVPAEYKTVRVRKLVTPTKEKVIVIPAKYQIVKKKVKKSAEIVAWRPKNTVGEGSPTGKSICRAEIPARYKTITKEVIKTPTTTRKVAIPAEFKDVKVRKLVSAAKEVKIDIPAKYQTVTKRIKTSEEKLAWRSVLCETNTSRGLVTELQRALEKAGFNPGPIDGAMGYQTQVAINEFQKKKGFERGGLTLRTLSALGVKVGK